MLVSRISGFKPDVATASAVALDGELSADDTEDDAAVSSCQCAINNRNVSGKDAGAVHTIPCNPHGERRRWVRDEQFVEVEWLIEVVVRRRRKPCRDAGHHQGHRRGTANLTSYRLFVALRSHAYALQLDFCSLFVLSVDSSSGRGMIM